MLTATGANIIEPDRSTTAIANHFLSPYFLYRYFTGQNLDCKQNLSENQNIISCQTKKIICGTRFADLPFWQFSRPGCHFGSYPP
jgi:hypothetical protein